MFFASFFADLSTHRSRTTARRTHNHHRPAPGRRPVRCRRLDPVAAAQLLASHPPPPTRLSRRALLAVRHPTGMSNNNNKVRTALCPSGKICTPVYRRCPNNNSRWTTIERHPSFRCPPACRSHQWDHPVRWSTQIRPPTGHGYRCCLIPPPTLCKRVVCT